jgi:hypothetical protein
MVKLKKLNEDTAIDKKGNGWFRAKTPKEHRYWVTCEKCNKRTQRFWFEWPNVDERKICDSCVDWLEK